MKKKMMRLICVGMMGVMLTACAETPTEKVVVDKSQGLAEESVIPVDDTTPKDLKAPEHWTETMEESDGFSTLTADCDIQIQDIYNTPVYSYEMSAMTDERLEDLCAYFSKGNKLYQEQPMTKSELNVQKEKMENYEGEWGYYYSQSMRTLLRDMIKRVDELIEEAPEQKGSPQYIEAKLTAPYQTEEDYVREVHSRRWNQWFYDTEDKIGLTARVDAGSEVNPIIRAIGYDENVGSVTGFLYQQGVWMDETTLERRWETQKEDDLPMEEYLSDLSNGMEMLADGTFTQEDALAEVEVVLEELSIEEMAVIDCVKVIGMTQSDSWAGAEDTELPKEFGYLVSLTVKAGDLTGYPLPYGRSFNDLPETVYAPAFMTESLDIIVTKEGVRRFEWLNISEKKDTVAENTKILTFEEIKKKLSQHLLYASISFAGDGAKEEGYTFQYQVKDIEMRAANVNAYEDIAATWLVPVWVFRLEWSFTDPSEKVFPLGEISVALNAIDGGYITVK